MAFLFSDSFDHYATGDMLEKWTQDIDSSIQNASAIGATGRRGSGAVRWTGSTYSGRCVTKLLISSGPTAVIGFAFQQSGTSFSGLTVDNNFTPSFYNHSNFIVGIRQGTVAQVWVRINGNGTLTVLRGESNSTVLGTTERALPFGVFVFVELKVLIDPTTGTIELRVNNETWLSLTAQNTRHTASATWNEIVIGGLRPQGGTGVIWDFDDLYVLDGSGAAPNTFLGDCRVDVRNMTAEGANAAWTPLSGTDNALMVDDAVPDDDARTTRHRLLGRRTRSWWKTRPCPAQRFSRHKWSSATRKQTPGRARWLRWWLVLPEQP